MTKQEEELEAKRKWREANLAKVLRAEREWRERNPGKYSKV